MVKNIHRLNEEKYRILGVWTMTWKMEENKIMALEFEPLYVVFERAETVQTQKTITGLTFRTSTMIVRMLGLDIVTVRTLIWAFECQDIFKNIY